MMSFVSRLIYAVFIISSLNINIIFTQEQGTSSTTSTENDAPSLTEILAIGIIVIAIVCMVIVLLLLWCLRHRRRQRQRQENSNGNQNNGYIPAVNRPTLPTIQEAHESPQKVHDTRQRPSYLEPSKFPPSSTGSQHGSELSEQLSEMTIADTTAFIRTAVDSYLRQLKDHYQFQDGQAPVLPVPSREYRPPSTTDAPPIPIKLPKRKKSLARKNTVNMNTYINGYDSSKWEIKRDQISIEDSPIGSGYFGDVYKATLNQEKKRTTVVVKTLKQDATNREKGQFLKEVATQALIEPHDHIIRLIGCCAKSTPYLMILEYAQNGSLCDFLYGKEPDKVQGRKNLVVFGHQISDGMAYLSEMKIVHRDLAARNILVTAEEVCKVSDFGFAKDIFGVKTYTNRMSLEPVRWMAPESIKDNVFSTKSDVWAFGVILWEIIKFSREKPYSDIDSHILRQQIVSGEHTILKKPKECPSDVFLIMKWCWSMNPDDRPSFHLLSDILDDMREEYIEASEIAFGTVPDMSRPSVVSYNDEELTKIASSRRISTDL